MSGFYCSRKGNIKLSGILYLHRISDNRIAPISLTNLSMFRELCGKDAFQRIILTTTMWDDLQIDEGGQREKELCALYWRTMAQQGSKVARFLRTTESAWSIVEPILLNENNRFAIEVQGELKSLKKHLWETKAGTELYITLDRLVQEQRNILQRIKEASEGTGDEHDLNQLKSEYDELRKQIGATIADIQLKMPLRTRLIRMLLWPLGLLMKVCDPLNTNSLQLTFGTGNHEMRTLLLDWVNIPLTSIIASYTTSACISRDFMNIHTSTMHFEVVSVYDNLAGPKQLSIKG